MTKTRSLGIVLLFVVLSGVGCTSPSGTAGAPGFGNVSLTSWQQRYVSIGPKYLNIRVCNDIRSNGPVIATIRSGWSRTLAPSACLTDRGDSFVVQNQGGSSVRVNYSAS
jgi:hypothetical protein